MGGEGALVALPELPTDRLAQDAGGDDPAGVLVEFLEQLQFLGGQSRSTVEAASSTLRFGSG